MSLRRGPLGRLVLAMALIAGLASAAQAQVWRMATKMPPNSPAGQSFQRFADKVQEYSGGKLTVNVFPSEQLGKTRAALEQLSAGIIQVYPEGSDLLNSWVPEIEYVYAPFLFDSREHWLRFMRSDLVKGWLARVEEQAGIVVLGDITAFMRGPYRVMSVTKPVRSLADMRSLKIRMFPNDLVVDAYTHLGAEVRILGWTEVYESIRRGIVEAVTHPISLVEPMKFNEVVSDVVRTDEFHQSVAFMVNARAYEGLSPEVRRAVDRAFVDAAEFSVTATLEHTTEMIERLTKEGIRFYSIDTTEFADRMRELYEERARTGELPAGFMATVDATRG